MINLKVTSIELNWAISLHSEIKGFIVERKVEDAEYLRLGFVEWPGLTQKPFNISFTDNKVPSRKISYRLMQINLDKSFEYSEELSIGSKHLNVGDK